MFTLKLHDCRLASKNSTTAKNRIYTHVSQKCTLNHRDLFSCIFYNYIVKLNSSPSQARYLP